MHNDDMYLIKSDGSRIYEIQSVKSGTDEKTKMKIPGYITIPNSNEMVTRFILIAKPQRVHHKTDVPAYFTAQPQSPSPI